MPALPMLRSSGVALLCAGLLGTGCSREPAAEAPEARPPPAAPAAAEEAESPASLDARAGTVVERSAEAGDVHRYRLALEAGGTVELSAEQRGVDLELAVFGPAGEPLFVTDRTAGPDEAEHARALAETPGVYGVEVRTWQVLSGDGMPGTYALRFDGLRAPTETDLRRAPAERLFARAEALRATEDRESCRRAVELYLEAGERFGALGDRRGQAEVLDRLGWVHRKYLQELRPALGYYSRALALFEELGADARTASVLNNLGRTRFLLGELDGALDAWQLALPIKRRLSDVAGEAASLGNLAMAYRYLGKIQEALGAYDRSLELLQRSGDRNGEARALNNRGRYYELLGEDRQARADLERALALSRELGSRRLEAVVLTALGNVQERTAGPETARQTLERALALRIAMQDVRGRAVTEQALGALYGRLGDTERAAALDRLALDGFRRVGAPREEADTLRALGTLALDAGRPDEARSLLRQALPTFRAIGDPFRSMETLLGLARAERARGDPHAGLALTEEALGEIERVRARLGSHALRTSFLAARHDHYDLEIALLMDLHRLEPEAGHARRALAASERSRVRSLLDRLAERGTSPAAGADPALLAEVRELERRLALLDRERIQRSDPAGKAPSPSLAAIEHRIDELVRALRAVRGRIRATSPRHTALFEPRILDAGEIQALLDPATALLEFHLGEERSWLWVVTTDSVTSFALPPRAAIETAARRAHELLTSSYLREPRQASALALSELSELILAPAASRLEALPGRRLLISPDGALWLVPFAALPAPDDPVASPLLAHHEIVTLPSASALAVLREQAAGRPRPAGEVAVLADPVFGAADPRLGRRAADRATESAPPGVRAPSSPPGGDDLRRLPFSGDEAAAILHLASPDASYGALGFESTREAALSPALGNYRIVHFATHGQFDDRHPELSRLVFSRFDPAGRARDGTLFAHEIEDLDLPADLVVLSACESALGQEVLGEGLVGLTQSFFHAGAERVVVSLWRVDDRATAELMARFYRGMLADGLAPAAALRRAQLSIGSEPGWGAPYYWAGFVLQGEWR